MKSSRKRNIARKARSIRARTATNTAPPHPDPRTGQPESPTGQTDSPIPQPEAAGFVLQNAPPDAAHREPEAGNGFVSQNRINAQHSTGPRTPEGKAASSQNAFKHGLSIQRHAVLRGEDPALYAQLLAELREIYEPRSRREDLAVEDIAQCRWAFARFDEAEAVCLQKLTDYSNDPEAFEGEEPINTAESLGHAATVLTDFDDKDRRYVEPDIHYPAFDKIHRYRTYWERKHTRALTEFDRAQRSRRADTAELRAEAAHLRAEEQARRQAEAQALKQELALARELRQRELHELRLAQACEKLCHQPPAPDPSAPNSLALSPPGPNPLKSLSKNPPSAPSKPSATPQRPSPKQTSSVPNSPNPKMASFRKTRSQTPRIGSQKPEMASFRKMPGYGKTRQPSPPQTPLHPSPPRTSTKPAEPRNRTFLNHGRCSMLA